jgi:hypothetical protein
MSTKTAVGSQIFKWRLYFLIEFTFFQQYIANMIGGTCNSRLPRENLQAGLNFVHAKN